MKLHAAAASALLALSLTLTAAPRTAPAADAYEIDALLPQSGNGAFLGTAQMVALKILEDLINKRGGVAGRPLKFVYLDDQSSPQTAVQLTDGILVKKPAVMLGSTLTAICSAEAPLAKDGPVIYCFSPGVHPPAGSYMFTAGTSTTDMIDASIRYFRARGWTKLAVLATTDATGQDLDNNVAQMLALPENKSVSVVAHEHFNATDVSVAAQIARIKSSGAQALIAWTVGGALATIFNGLQSAGVDLPVLATPGNMTYAQMKQYAGFLPKELYFPGSASFAPEQLPNGPEKRAVNAYLDAFKAIGVRPDQGHLFVWDPVLMLVDALNKLGPNATPDQVRSFINDYHGTGVFGRYDFHAEPQRGIGVDSVIMVRWNPDKDTWVGVSKAGGEPLR
ncbi:MAG: ABC transporter substrate-binding protein [Candidatus Lustribacter sp.]|jgi:branched-chain amino acid transport system substrate-binding protein